MEDQAKQVVGKTSPSRYKNPLGLPRYRKNIYVQLTSNFLRKWWKPKSKAINIIETKVKDWERYLNYWVCWLTLAVFCNFNSNHFSGSCAGKKKKKKKSRIDETRGKKVSWNGQKIRSKEYDAFLTWQTNFDL